MGRGQSLRQRWRVVSWGDRKSLKSQCSVRKLALDKVGNPKGVSGKGSNTSVPFPEILPMSRPVGVINRIICMEFNASESTPVGR